MKLIVVFTFFSFKKRITKNFQNGSTGQYDIKQVKNKKKKIIYHGWGIYQIEMLNQKEIRKLFQLHHTKYN